MKYITTILLVPAMFLACGTKDTSGDSSPSRGNKEKASPPTFDCGAINLKKLSSIAGTTYKQSSKASPVPDTCVYEGGMSGRIQVMGVGGRQNLSETKIANAGNPWTKDKGLSVNISPFNNRLGMAVSVYGDFKGKQGVHVSLSGVQMSREAYKALEAESDRMGAINKAYKNNVKVALYLVHQFKDLQKGKTKTRR